MDTQNNQTASNAAIHIGEHEQRLTLHCDYWIPDHAEPRTASPTYVKARHHIINVLDTPCWVCGSKEQRETHHTHIEHCFAEAVDWAKVAADFPNFDWQSFDPSHPETWLDSEQNLRVYCKLHHTGPRGVHTNPYPDFVVQRYLRDGFQEF